MTSRLDALCMDAQDPAGLASFWAAALGWDISGADTDDEIGLAPTDGTTFGILFEPVAEPKVDKNRLHLDLTTSSDDDQTTTLDRLIELGARPIDIGQGADERHVVLVDPDGQRVLRHRARQFVPRRLRPPRVDHVRRITRGRTVLE